MRHRKSIHEPRFTKHCLKRTKKIWNLKILMRYNVFVAIFYIVYWTVIVLIYRIVGACIIYKTSKFAMNKKYSQLEYSTWRFSWSVIFFTNVWLLMRWITSNMIILLILLNSALLVKFWKNSILKKWYNILTCKVHVIHKIR